MRYRLRDLFWLIAIIAAALGGYCWRNGEVNELAQKWSKERVENMKLGIYVQSVEESHKLARTEATILQRQLAALQRQREPLYDELFAHRHAEEAERRILALEKMRPPPLIWETSDPSHEPLEAPEPQ